MERAKGTPGLWHVDADGMSIVTEDGMVVAEVQFPHDGDREGIREAEADAFRLAAVPQMEAALEAVERYMGGPSDDPCFGRVEENENDDDTLRVLDIVRSAIAAARGESEEVRS